MLPRKILLVDRNPRLVAAWEEAFARVESVEVRRGDFFSSGADVMTSPANSFGIMDGGLDLAIRNELGMRVQRAVQDVILRDFHGELPVGSAIVVPTGNPMWPHLVCAPTMRVPGNISRTANAYLAFRAALLAIHGFNRLNLASRIESMVCPGLGTGVGRLDERRCAAQMRIAFDSVHRPARIPSFREIHALHDRLLTS